MTYSNRIKPFQLLMSFMLFAAIIATDTHAQVSEDNSDAPDFDDPNVQNAIQYMLERAQLTRSLATEHLTYMQKNRASAEIRLMEDASQVMAFNILCEDEKIEEKTINHIAADTSFRIAMLAGDSTISTQLARITESQPVSRRMELIGDMATTVLMFEVGRRKGMFDALVTDFGVKRFCAGMQDDMRTRYNALASNLGSEQE